MKDIVTTRTLHLDRPFRTAGGRTLNELDIAYETYGSLNAAKNNAILIEHALSGSAHAAGYHEGDPKPGWWDSMIGPGKAFDTERYFIICSNVLGGCSGTTGPASINPATGRPYGLDFPPLTIRDMVEVQRILLAHLGITELRCVAGGSMGGMQTLQFCCDYPLNSRAFIVIASAMKHSAQQIAFNEVGRRAIMADPRWNNGDYYEQVPPEGGLSVARMIGHITYLSESMMQKKFGRDRKQAGAPDLFRPQFEVQHYLDHQGLKFVKRFDANTYLYITNAIDNFDLMASIGGQDRSRGNDRARGRDLRHISRQKGLVISFTSDWLYPPEQGREIVQFLSGMGVRVSFAEIESEHGHDSFLTDVDSQSSIIRGFLDSIV